MCRPRSRRSSTGAEIDSTRGAAFIIITIIIRRARRRRPCPMCPRRPSTPCIRISRSRRFTMDRRPRSRRPRPRPVRRKRTVRITSSPLHAAVCLSVCLAMSIRRNLVLKRFLARRLRFCVSYLIRVTWYRPSRTDTGPEIGRVIEQFKSRIRRWSPLARSRGTWRVIKSCVYAWKRNAAVIIDDRCKSTLIDSQSISKTFVSVEFLLMHSFELYEETTISSTIYIMLAYLRYIQSKLV